ncbi:DoxX family protein [Duganella sp. LX47W]|uniref:DoxX family protein n=2 Tax=Rugamonas apoptosis TaxID=2758570 RepID=A0A7W2IMP4_9BURK|nr:DoxX family protein [Rugamonas apoptosis]
MNRNQHAGAAQAMDKKHNLMLLLARVLLALIFIAAGIDKLGHYGATVTMMESMAVPGSLLPAVVALELGGGVAICFGAFTRPVALCLAIFCVVAAVLFHKNFADATQAAMFMKNLAIAGGFLSLAVAGAGTMSIDARHGDSRKPARARP